MSKRYNLRHTVPSVSDGIWCCIVFVICVVFAAQCMLNGPCSFATTSFGCVFHWERSFKRRAAVVAEIYKIIALWRVDKFIGSNFKETGSEFGNGCAATARSTEIHSPVERSQTVCQCSSFDIGIYRWLDADSAHK